MPGEGLIDRDKHQQAVAGVIDYFGVSRSAASLYVVLAIARGRTLAYGFLIEALHEAEGEWLTEQAIRTRARRLREFGVKIDTISGVGLRLVELPPGTAP